MALQGSVRSGSIQLMLVLCLALWITGVLTSSTILNNDDFSSGDTEDSLSDDAFFSNGIQPMSENIESQEELKASALGDEVGSVEHLSSGLKGDNGHPEMEPLLFQGQPYLEDQLLRLQGPRGPPGPQGLTGPRGLQGAIGPPGEQGPSGDLGYPGLHGPPGFQGPIGRQGRRGPTGSPGNPGPPGSLGPQGHSGEQGPKGDQGYRGYKGAQGGRGPRGEKGNRGPVVMTLVSSRQASSSICKQGEKRKTLSWSVYEKARSTTDWSEFAYFCQSYYECSLEVGQWMMVQRSCPTPQYFHPLQQTCLRCDLSHLALCCYRALQAENTLASNNLPGMKSLMDGSLSALHIMLVSFAILLLAVSVGALYTCVLRRKIALLYRETDRLSSHFYPIN